MIDTARQQDANRLRVDKALVVAVLLITAAACARVSPDGGQAASDGARVSRDAIADPAWPSETVRYRCHDGVPLQVAYRDGDDGASFAALYYDGRLSLMRSWPGASGPRYVSLDEQVGLRWRREGAVGRLSFLAADHTAEEIVLLSDCRPVANGSG